MRAPQIHRTKKTPSIYGRFTVMHSHKNGHAVLRGQSSWRTVCGVLIQTRKSRWMVTWR